MKTVGILTSQWFDNYGTVFQAFALQEAVRNLGCNVHIIPWEVDKLTGIRRFISPSIKRTFSKLQHLKIARDFNSFREKHFDRGGLAPFYFFDADKHKFEEDVLIFGSDNIWGVGDLDIDTPYLDIWFGSKINHGNKISYAVSTGGYLREHRYCRQIIDKILNGGFNYISLREPCNVQLLQENGGQNVCFSPDPTFLHKRSFWEGLMKPFPRESVYKKYGYVFGYGLNYNQNDVPISKLAKHLAADLGKRVCLAYPMEFFRYRFNSISPTPAEWLSAIAHAECVVTNSYHGVVFSLIFNTPFIYSPIIGNGSSCNMRVFELLRLFNLENRILIKTESFGSKMSREIDWSGVAAQKEKLAKIGMDYLKMALAI